MEGTSLRPSPPSELSVSRSDLRARQEAEQVGARGDRHMDLAGLDLRLELVHLRDECRRHLRADRAHADAVVPEVEQQVGATLEVALLGLLVRREDAGVDPLERAREHVLREAVLVDVDTDAPDTGLGRGVERAETAAAGDLELDLRALADLILGQRLALV